MNAGVQEDAAYMMKDKKSDFSVDGFQEIWTHSERVSKDAETLT